MRVKIKRLIAVYIDFIILFFVIYTCLYLIQEVLYEIIAENIFGLITLILMIFIYPRKDCLIGYESIGKKIMRLGIYQNGERVKDKKLLQKRFMETLYYIPLYPFMILINNKSSGDIELKTEVKELKRNKASE